MTLATAASRINAALYGRIPLFILVFLALYGFGYGDVGDFRVIAAHPLALDPDFRRGFLYSSPLTFFIGHPFILLFSYQIAFAITAGLGFAALLLAYRRYVGGFAPEERRPIFFALAATPLLLVLLSWIGKSDTYLIAAYLLVLAARSAPIRALAVAAMILAHRDLATVMLAGHVLVGRRVGRAEIAAFVAAQLAILGYLYWLLPTPPLARASLALGGLAPLLSSTATNPAAHLVLCFGWFWLVVFRCREWLAPWRVALYLAITLGVAALTLDYTRIFNLCALPLVLHVIEAELRQRGGRGLAFLGRPPFPALCLIQAQVVASWHVYDSNWPALIARLAG